jgi:hypothetical protein
MSDQHSAQGARFVAFMALTSAQERDWIAFVKFERAVAEAASVAAMLDMYDGGEQYWHEQAVLKRAIGVMLYGVLGRIDLSVIVGNAAGIGYAIRHGLIDHRDAFLDRIDDDAAFQALARRGELAAYAEWQKREATLMGRKPGRRGSRRKADAARG